MIKGLISHKVRQSAPKPPVKKCSPPRSEASEQRGRKAVPKERVPLIAESIAGLDKQRFPHIPNEVWNALSSTVRSSVLALLQLVETFSRDCRNDPLELIQETIPQWEAQTGIAVMEATLVGAAAPDAGEQLSQPDHRLHRHRTTRPATGDHRRQSTGTAQRATRRVATAHCDGDDWLASAATAGI